jgi:hypothetical protein
MPVSTAFGEALVIGDEYLDDFVALRGSSN